MNETIVTVRGYVGAEVSLRAAGEVDVASFRVAATPRRYSRRTESWSDAPTQWFTVSAWRGLAGNVATSLHTGDAVIVQGRLSLHSWTDSEGVEQTSYEIDADLVGHDLSKGTAVFTKPVREPRAAPEEEAVQPADPVSDWRVPGGDSTAA
ncbi:single-stranded DNA-binding protein [Nocardioides insulae]|uniref:single-stranded DNA-binding protein n=1 Tax=Nocardioides insulae TaxID=394734 RepID=UPI0004031ACA|nr:single-stranded DNA-binding protein [Nocardioides insulae]